MSILAHHRRLFLVSEHVQLKWLMRGYLTKSQQDLLRPWARAKCIGDIFGKVLGRDVS